MIAWLLVAATPLANGISVDLTPRTGAPWVEMRVHVATEVDPPALRGLTAVSTRVIDRALTADPACAGVCSATLDGDGFSIRSGAAPERVEAELARIFEVVRAAGGAGSVERSVRSAAAALEGLRADDRRLAYFALMQAMFAGHPASLSPLGDVVGVSRVTADDVSAFVRRNFVGARVSIAMAGAIDPALDLGATAGGLARGTTVTSTVTAPRTLPRVRVVVVDKPDRAHAETLVGWPIDGTDVAALEAARIAWGGTTDSPLAGLARELGATAVAQIVRRRGATAAIIEVSSAAETAPRLLDALLAARRTVERRGLATEALERGIAGFEVATVLDRRDAAHVVTHRFEPEVAPVDVERARRGIRTYVAAEGLVAVILASATPELLGQLAALPQVDEVSVVAYDNF